MTAAQPNPDPTAVASVTRRRFLAWSGVTAGAAAIGGAYATAGRTEPGLPDLQQAATERPLPLSDGILVVVTLYGGNDGLNTVVPAADPVYQDSRRGMAYRPAQVLDLGDGLGLNPGMTGLKGLWDQDRLAIVRGVGYPEPDHSHFTSMAIWQTGAPRSPEPTGWLGRWLDVQNDALQAVTFEGTLPPMLAGERLTGIVCPTGSFALGQPDLTRAMQALALPDPRDTPAMAEAAASNGQFVNAVSALQPSLETEPVISPQSAFQRQLSIVARMIESGVPSRVYSVSLGGFDTHANELATQQRLLSQLDAALTAFQSRLDRTDRGRMVTTMVYSEFGRRVEANAAQGTDHGTAAPVFLLGRGVRPGFHGEQPTLTELTHGDLRSHVDFRDVYANVLHRVLDADPPRFLQGWTGESDVLT